MSYFLLLEYSNNYVIWNYSSLIHLYYSHIYFIAGGPLYQTSLPILYFNQTGRTFKKIWWLFLWIKQSESTVWICQYAGIWLVIHTLVYQFKASDYYVIHDHKPITREYWENIYNTNLYILSVVVVDKVQIKSFWFI